MKTVKMFLQIVAVVHMVMGLYRLIKEDVELSTNHFAQAACLLVISSL